MSPLWQELPEKCRQVRSKTTIREKADTAHLDSAAHDSELGVMSLIPSDAQGSGPRLLDRRSTVTGDLSRGITCKITFLTCITCKIVYM